MTIATGLTECECSQPVRNPAPAKRRTCVKCGYLIAPRWESNDANLTRFFNRLTSCQSAPITLSEFLAHCERREVAGRDRFGFLYLTRDNIAECAEELADALIYMYLEQLSAERDGDPDDGDDLAYQVAFHAAEAYQALAELARVRGVHMS